MLLKKCLILFIVLLVGTAGMGQTKDTIPAVTDESLALDLSNYDDDMLDDLGNFLDSILAPRSYFLASGTLSRNFFTYKNSSNTGVETKKQWILSPTLGYYHKSGLGLSASAASTNTGKRFENYQYSITPSFDFIKSRKWIGGFSYTHYFTKDSVGFYTSPLQNDVNAYFLWRKSWLQPGFSFTYGWGSRTEIKKRARYIQLIRLRRLASIIQTVNTEENASDLSLSLSLRHSFYWLELSKASDYIKFTPMLVFTSGTQKYGFNQTSSGSYAITERKTGTTTVEYRTGNVSLDNNLKYQPLSLTLYLRPEYNFSKFFIQPQLILDYYFPGTENNFTAMFSINGGIMF